MADRGRGANWVLFIKLPRPFGGAEVTYSQDTRSAMVTVPFATEQSARDAMSCVEIEVRPGENHVIQGSTIGPDEMAELEMAAGFTQEADDPPAIAIAIELDESGQPKQAEPGPDWSWPEEDQPWRGGGEEPGE